MTHGKEDRSYEAMEVKTARAGSFIKSSLDSLLQKTHALNEIENGLREHGISMFGSTFFEDHFPIEPIPSKSYGIDEPSVLEALGMANERFEKSINEIGRLLDFLKSNT